MEVDGLLTIAKKEFIDHLTSRRFIILLVLFLIISAVSMHQGIGDYNDALEMYKGITSQIKEGGGLEQESIPDKPTILMIFQEMASHMAILGTILAIALGFDLITREKESRSLKSLLTHPIFRDEIINGKAIGGFLALTATIGFALLISFAVLLLFSIVPDIGQFWRIVIFGVASVLFLLTYFSIALMTSTISENSGTSLIYALIIFIVLSFFVPMVGGLIAEGMVGAPPEPPVITSARENKPIEMPLNDEEWQRYEEESRAYWSKLNGIYDVIYAIVPAANYRAVTTEVLNSNSNELNGGDEVLERIWKNILALIIFPIIFFVIAYIKFMRMDIR